MERLVTTAQAAELLNISLQGVHYRIKSKKLKSIKQGNKTFVYIEDIPALPLKEIKETIKLGRLFTKQKKDTELNKSRLIAIFQPHRYSRVKQFTKEFAEELSKADVIYVTSIYGAGEEYEDKITSKVCFPSSSIS